MSKWTDIRDGILEQINPDTITAQFKEDLYNSIMTEFIPFISDTGEKLAHALEESAKTEDSTWCKLRDSFILPTSIRLLVWVVKTALTTTSEHRKDV